MSIKKNVLNACMLLVILFSLTNCGMYIPPTFTYPGANPSVEYNFDYQPEVGRKLEKPLTLLMVKGESKFDFPVKLKLGKNFTGVTNDVKENFNKIADSYSSAIIDDFKEMVTSQGFRIQGTLLKQNEVTWPQREQSDFCLMPNVDVYISDQILSTCLPSQGLKDALMTNKVTPGLVSGKLSVKARIKLDIFEPLSWQLLWTKSIETEQLSMEYSYKWNYTDTQGRSFVVGEDSRPQIIAKVLQDTYKETMDKLFVYLDPSELAALNKQAQELRKKTHGLMK